MLLTEIRGYAPIYLTMRTEGGAGTLAQGDPDPYIGSRTATKKEGVPLAFIHGCIRVDWSFGEVPSATLSCDRDRSVIFLAGIPMLKLDGERTPRAYGCVSNT